MPRKGTTPGAPRKVSKRATPRAHAAARADSGLTLIWAWARRRRTAWTAVEAAEAGKISAHRARALVRALVEAGHVEVASARRSMGRGQGFEAPTYQVAETARAIAATPITIVKPGDSQIRGIRFPDAGS